MSSAIPQSAQEARLPLTKAHKAAVILAALSPDTASAIIKEISDAHLKAFARAFAELKSVPPSLLQAVAQEFVYEVERSSAELAGGLSETKKILESLAEEDRANRILSELNGGGTDSVWNRLSEAPPDRLLAYLQTHRKPIAAVILSKIRFDQAAALFAISDSDYSNALLAEIARSKPPANDVIAELALAIEEDFLKPLLRAPAVGGVNEIVCEIINFLPSSKREAFLTHLDKEDVSIAKAVRKAVLTFDALHARLSEAGAGVLLKAMDREILIPALKYGEHNAADTVKFLLANVSKRMAEQYSEEMLELGEVTEESGESAQREFMKKLRELAASGEIKLLAGAA